ncbi:MAG: MBL fold metallo-hydrolase [Oscillospiraceae bacterium]|nr:MBL fold metallo-hydrolase [Oscillospiraceae bacterium]
MLAKILIDNAAGDGLCAEWGLSIWLEYREHCFLLDAGATEKFAENATAMGLHLADASFGVLSHAHYDHADGLDAFFAQNRHAPVYLRRGAAENYYRREGLHLHYIGIRRGYLEQYQARFRYVDGVFSPEPGVTLLPHSTPGLSAAGRRAGMYIRNRGTLLPRPDSFTHEQTLVLEAAGGLVAFNSCSHGGADCILQEVAAAFPGRRICAFCRRIAPVPQHRAGGAGSGQAAPGYGDHRALHRPLHRRARHCAAAGGAGRRGSAVLQRDGDPNRLAAPNSTELHRFQSAEDA